MSPDPRTAERSWPQTQNREDPSWSYFHITAEQAALSFEHVPEA